MATFKDYKIKIVQSNHYPDKNVAYIEELHSVSAIIDKDENAAKILQPLFEKEIERLRLEKKSIPISGAGKAEITFATNNKIKNLSPFIDDFWDKILGTSYSSSFVSDESRLRDWEHYLNSENRTIIKKVKDIYGVDIEGIYNEPIHEVLVQIKNSIRTIDNSKCDQ